MPDFATRLRELRKGRQLRQVDLAQSLGIAQTTIANYEQHSRFPDEQMLLKIASFFGVSLDYLLGRADLSVAPESSDTLRNLVQVGPESIGEKAQAYLRNVLAGDPAKAFGLVFHEVELGIPIRHVYAEILTPALRAVGTMWERGELGIAGEHFLTECTRDLLGQVRSRMTIPERKRGIVVLAAPGAESHLLGLQMLGDILEEAGWMPYRLGGNIPTDDVVEAIIQMDAKALCLTATMPIHVDAVTQLIRLVRGTRKIADLFVLVGGVPFVLDPGLVKRVGADATAGDPGEAIAQLEPLTGAA